MRGLNGLMGCRGFYAFREKLEGVLDPGSEILTCIILKTARSIFKLWISSDGICYFIIAEFDNWFHRNFPYSQEIVPNVAKVLNIEIFEIYFQ